jgi:hypothetical protein
MDGPVTELRGSGALNLDELAGTFVVPPRTSVRLPGDAVNFVLRYEDEGWIVSRSFCPCGDDSDY